MESTKFNNQLTIPQMMEKLDELYKRKEQTQRLVKAYIVLLEQLDEDIDLAEQMIMYTSNKRSRNGAI
jgi:hypothetical protein